MEIKVPAVGESITEATIAQWLKKEGEWVKKNDVLISLETDKATVEVVAEEEGQLKVMVPAGTVVKIGATVGMIDKNGKPTTTGAAPSAAAVVTPPPSPINSNPGISAMEPVLSPAVRRVVEERGLDPAQITGTGPSGRILKSDAEGAVAGSPVFSKTFAAPTSAGTPSPVTPPASPKPATPAPTPTRVIVPGSETVRRVPMTTIRKKIAQRLVEAQHTAAILTTFNEVNMGAVMSIREKYKDKFKEKYGVSLGFMGFFVKAAIEALKEIPEVNATIEGDDIVYKDYFHVGVAVGTEKGLVVPVIRHADQLSLAGIELAIRDFAKKARDQKLSVNDLSGGTFTISNGGVYGSLMSTPILNPPQSGILGMHKIEERPIVVDKKIEAHPMMYLALSYDHRIIDGKGAVTFLVKIKECLEDPSRILLEI